MTIPILGSSTGISGRAVCVVCGGNINDPDHKHIYADVKLLHFYDGLCRDLLLFGCMIIDPESGQVFLAHPSLKEGYVWAPTAEEVAFKKKEVPSQLHSEENLPDTGFSDEPDEQYLP